MFKSKSVTLALAGWCCGFTLQAAEFARSIISYEPGAGFATEFSSGAGYTNAVAALGEPSRVTPGMFGGPVDAFSPPYLKEQIVSIGTGGSLTLGFGTPILDAAQNPFGIDFIIFGSAGFVITNGNFTGGGVTDGSLFSANVGSTRVSVSADNLTWYVLDPAKAPMVDGMFPTEGSGDFAWPVDPALTSMSFAGKDLAGIRELYAGSGGGGGFDLAWALDVAGQSARLPAVNFIRIDVLSGTSEVDGVAIVPEPRVWTLLLLGVASASGVGLVRLSRARNVGGENRDNP